MAYSTGTTTTGQGLMSAIETALTANGWTLHDDLRASSKVFKSTGTDSKQNIYIRATNRESYLYYDNEISGFVVGETLTGGTSGATALIVEVVDDGTTGRLTLVDVNGTFDYTETVTSASGEADNTGALQYPEYNDPGHLDNQFHTISFKSYSYWDNSAHTGTNERQNFGPYFLNGQTDQASASLPEKNLYPSLSPLNRITRAPANSDLIRPFRFDDLFDVETLSSTLNKMGFAKAASAKAICQNNGYGAIVGHSPLSTTDEFLTRLDLSDRTYSLQGNGTGHTYTSNGNTAGITVHNRFDKETYIYYINSQGPTFRKRNINTGQDAVLSIGGFSSIVSGGIRMAFDGGKYIYAIGGNSTTSTFRFDISNETWSAALATSPAAPSGLTAPFDSFAKLIYLPADTVPGGAPWDEDRILCPLAQNTSIYAYNVLSNTWTTNAIVAPTAFASATSWLSWDSQRYIYMGKENYYYYRLDLQDIAAGWQMLSDELYYQSTSQGTSRQLFSTQVAKVQVGMESYQYGILCDANHIKVWTGVNNDYYWAYAGKYDSLRNTAIATVTSSASAGSAVTVAVDSSNGLSPGDIVSVFRPSDGSFTFSAIESVPTATSIVITTTRALAINDQITEDGTNIILGGDTGLGVIKYDHSSIGENYDLFVMLKDPGSGNSQKAGLTTNKIIIGWDLGNMGGVQRDSAKGTLTGVLSVADPQSLLTDRSVITDSSGNQYIVFQPKARKLARNKNKIALGPL